MADQIQAMQFYNPRNFIQDYSGIERIGQQLGQIPQNISSLKTQAQGRQMNSQLMDIRDVAQQNAELTFKMKEEAYELTKKHPEILIEAWGAAKKYFEEGFNEAPEMEKRRRSRALRIIEPYLADAQMRKDNNYGYDTEFVKSSWDKIQDLMKTEATKSDFAFAEQTLLGKPEGTSYGRYSAEKKLGLKTSELGQIPLTKDVSKREIGLQAKLREQKDKIRTLKNQIELAKLRAAKSGDDQAAQRALRAENYIKLYETKTKTAQDFNVKYSKKLNHLTEMKIKRDTAEGKLKWILEYYEKEGKYPNKTDDLIYNEGDIAKLKSIIENLEEPINNALSDLNDIAEEGIIYNENEGLFDVDPKRLELYKTSQEVLQGFISGGRIRERGKVGFHSGSSGGEGGGKVTESDYQSAADSAGIDSDFLKSINYTETGYGKNVVSDTGITEDFQLSQAIKKKYGLKSSGNSPAELANAAASHLKELLQLYNNDEKKALAAYNGGKRLINEAIELAKKKGTTWENEIINTKSIVHVAKRIKKYSKTMKDKSISYIIGQKIKEINAHGNRAMEELKRLRGSEGVETIQPSIITPQEEPETAKGKPSETISSRFEKFAKGEHEKEAIETVSRKVGKAVQERVAKASEKKETITKIGDLRSFYKKENRPIPKAIDNLLTNIESNISPKEKDRYIKTARNQNLISATVANELRGLYKGAKGTSEHSLNYNKYIDSLKEKAPTNENIDKVFKKFKAPLLRINQLVKYDGKYPNTKKELEAELRSVHYSLKNIGKIKKVGEEIENKLREFIKEDELRKSIKGK